MDCTAYLDARWWLDVSLVAHALWLVAAVVMLGKLGEARDRNAAQRDALVDAQHRLDSAAIELNALRREVGP